MPNPRQQIDTMRFRWVPADNETDPPTLEVVFGGRKLDTLEACSILADMNAHFQMQVEEHPVRVNGYPLLKGIRFY